MDSPLQEYPALLASLQPSQAANVLNDRLKVMNKVNSDIADWLQERRRVEDIYVQGLRRLARRPMQDHGASLGVFQVPWKRIVSSTESMAQSHETLAQKIEADVERPLRDYATKNNEMQSMPTIQNDLANLSKSMESTQKKADKLKDKKSDKAANALSAANEAKQQWESRAPFVFEKLQAVDESRVNHLRDLLTQLETHELDLLEQNRKTVENCLNALLSVETSDEIKRFATKIGGTGAAVTKSTTGASSERHTRSTSESETPLPQPPKINHDDAVSQLSGRSSHAPPPPASESRPIPFGGLRRLGTVMGRRKSVIQTPGGGFTQEKRHRGPFGAKRGGSSQDSQQPGSPSPPQTGHTGQSEALSVTSHDDSSIRPTSARQGTNDAMEPISEGQQTPKAANEMGVTNTAVQGEPQKATENETDAEGFSMRPDTVDEITRLQRESSATEEPSPNLTIRDQPIHEDENAAQQAMSDVASRLRQQAQQSGIRRNAGTLRGRRDVRNTVFVPNATSPDQELSPLTPESVAPLPTPQAPRNIATPHALEERTNSETNSIHSSHTHNSMSAPVTHPDLHEPGLNASIVETVSAWFSDGAATKSFVVGELALAYNATGDPAPESERVRLDNFQILEKVAANPHFVTEASPMQSVKGKEREGSEDEKTGEYNVALSLITRPTPTVAFKYQVHLDSSNLSSYSPVIFTPTWNLEEFQASVIIAYAVNPSFTSLGSFTLKNLVLTVDLDLSPDETADSPREVARATQAVMYPNAGAAFRRKQSAAVWKIPDFEVKAGSDGKFLARFSTAASWPRKGKVEAKFEVTTSSNEARLGMSACTAPTTEQKEIDPFADEIPGTVQAEPKPNLTAWKGVPLSRKLTTGKYVSS